MLSMLDNARTWILQAVVYRGELEVIVAEGFVSDEKEDLRVGSHVIKDTRPIEVRDDGHLVTVRFSQCIAWQVVDESYTTFDEYEQRDDTGTLQTLSRSKYFDYVRGSHGWFEDIVGPAKHYRVWTEDEVIDVVACKPPIVEPWSGT